MNKFLKWVLLTVGFVVVLVVIASVVLPMVIDPNNYKEEISAAVLKQTGRELTIAGDIKWTVFPSLGLGFSDVRLGDRDGVGDDTFDIGEANISVKLMPLFSKKVEIGKVNLNDMSVKLKPKADGEGGRQDGTSVTSPDEPSQVAFSLSGLEISNAHITLENAGQTDGVGGFDLSAPGTLLGQPFDLTGGFTLKLPEEALQGDVKFAGFIQTAANGKRFDIEGMDVSFDGYLGDGEERVPLDSNISADANIDLTQDTIALRDLIFELHDLLVMGDLDVTSTTNEPKFAGKLKVGEFNPKAFLKKMGIDAPETRDNAALTSLQADMRFTGSDNSANLQELTARFDDSNLNGFLRIDDFEKRKLVFEFEIDQLNLDNYEEVESATTSSGQARETDLSARDFRHFTGGGKLRIGTLVLSGLTATNVSTTLAANNDGFRFYPVNASFYGGKHEGEIKVDATGNRPVLRADLGLSGVQAGDLLEDLTGSARLLGLADVYLKVRSDITNSQTSLQTLSGEIAMSILNGSIAGIDVTKTIGLVQDAVGERKDVSGEGTPEQRTRFAELSISGVIDKGVMKSDDLIMQSPLIRATGSGSFNLVDETLDYLLEPVLIADSGVQKLDKLSGYAIPIRLSGNLYEPDYKVDVAAAILSSQKDVIDKKKNELIDKLLGGKKKEESPEDQGN